MVYAGQEEELLETDDEEEDEEYGKATGVEQERSGCQQHEDDDVRRLLEVPARAVDSELNRLGEQTVWVPDAQLAYRMCSTISCTHDGNTLTVSYKDDRSAVIHKKSVDRSSIQPTSLSHLCADMCNLTELNEASVLHTIRSRYKLRLIHTYSGLFCVVVNPWEVVPLYSKSVIAYYQQQGKVDNSLPPHIYSVAQQAYDGLTLHSTTSHTSHTHNQSILITGESGAGKTENTKKIIEYLICAAAAATSTKRSSGQAGLDAAILSAGLALEAFSNAKTVHNNNSSRLNIGDRNFHVFYQIFSNGLCSSHQLKALGLTKKPSDYKFLNQGGAVTDHQIDDCENGQATKKALEQLNFTHLEQGWILECVVVCILIGEVRFGERQGLDMSFVEDFGALDNVAKLLGVNSYKLMEALTQPSIRIGENVIKKNQGLKKIVSIDDHLAEPKTVKWSNRTASWRKWPGRLG